MSADSKSKRRDESTDSMKRPLFMGTLFILHILYFAVFFGLAYIDETYIRILSTTIQVFVCLFLIQRFHPFRQYTITQFDASVIFASATFLLTNVVTTELFSSYINNISNEAKGLFSKAGPVTTGPSSIPTYAPNPELTQVSVTQDPSQTTPVSTTSSVTSSVTSSTPDQEQSAKLLYYMP